MFIRLIILYAALVLLLMRIYIPILCSSFCSTRISCLNYFIYFLCFYFYWVWTSQFREYWSSYISYFCWWAVILIRLRAQIFYLFFRARFNEKRCFIFFTFTIDIFSIIALVFLNKSSRYCTSQLGRISYSNRITI